MATALKRITKVQREVLASQASTPEARQVTKVSAEVVQTLGVAEAAMQVRKVQLEALTEPTGKPAGRALTKMNVDLVASATTAPSSRSLARGYVEVLCSQQEKLIVGLPDLGEVNPFLLDMPVVAVVRAVSTVAGEDVETPFGDCTRLWYRMTVTKSNGQQLLPFVDDQPRVKPNPLGHDEPQKF
jgi:hypothetical protein